MFESLKATTNIAVVFFFSSRRRHTRCSRDWSSDVCSSDLNAAAYFAGPGVILSFVIAGSACALTGLCYAELASAMPVSGSSYTYCYAALGERSEERRVGKEGRSRWSPYH